MQKKDIAVMTVGLVIFWPSLFFLAAGEDQKNEIARLKGESEALEQAAIKKQCTDVLAQLKEARKLQNEQKLEEKERAALVDERLQECIDKLGRTCKRTVFEVEVDKEIAARKAAIPENQRLPNVDTSDKSTIQ